MGKLIQSSLNEHDLVKIRTALNEPTLLKAIEAMEVVLKELGYYKISGDPPLIDMITYSNKGLETILTAIVQAQRDADVKFYKDN